jgi:hypothetical protein
VPKEARWSHLRANAKQPTIRTLIDEAMREIEKLNASLKGMLAKDYARPALTKVMLGELIDLISKIALNEDGSRSKEVLGCVYEYSSARLPARRVNAVASSIRHAPSSKCWSRSSEPLPDAMRPAGPGRGVVSVAGGGVKDQLSPSLAAAPLAKVPGR